ncbi:hypothetical protein K438DRAFT_2169167 [Mycena galopus ATCC 62051]|nr:hypothetical protein K438DRAFT_2169167 [Mycena galopus ATCC 62051]
MDDLLAFRKEDFLFSTTDEPLIQIWSVQDSFSYLSLLAPPSDIPVNASKYLNKSPSLLSSGTPQLVLRDLDFTRGPVWYFPAEHWLGWTPKEGLPAASADPINFLFSSTPVQFTYDLMEMYGVDDEAIDPSEPVPVKSGFRISTVLVDRVSATAKQLHGVAVSLASASSWYCHPNTTIIEGDMPGPPGCNTLSETCLDEEEMNLAWEQFKRSCLSVVGFISWILPLISAEEILESEDHVFVMTLQLSARAKTGVIYNLSRDYHEANFIHLLHHEVPIHAVVTEGMKKDWRFLRVHPDVWAEYETARSEITTRKIRLDDLPGYYEWADDWSRSDWFFQNCRAGKIGEYNTHFLPGADLGVIDFHLYGRRLLISAGVKRAYTERFLCSTHHHLTAEATTLDSYTLYRQNPIRLDEPSFRRVQPSEHVNSLDTFGMVLDGEEDIERQAFFENTYKVREQVKNKYAPRPNRSFNSWDGSADAHPQDRDITRGPSPSFHHGDARRQGRGGYRGTRRRQESRRGFVAPSQRPALVDRLTNPGANFMYNNSPSPSARYRPRSRDPGRVARLSRSEERQRRSSRSRSPQGGRGAARRGWPDLTSSGSSSVHEEFSEIPRLEFGARTENALCLPELERNLSIPLSEEMAGHMEGQATLGQNLDWGAYEDPEGTALRAIRAWRSRVLEDSPVLPPFPQLPWNLNWLNQSILYFPDPRSEWRFKAIVALDKKVHNSQDLLELAIRFGIPFELYVRRSRVREFRDVLIPALATRTLGSLYQPGYIDPQLTWSREGGNEASYSAYEIILSSFLDRPEAVALICAGGVYCFIALLYNPDLITRFA